MHCELSMLSHVAKKHTHQSVIRKETMYFLCAQNITVGITAEGCWTIIKRTMWNTELLDDFHKSYVLFGVSGFYETLEWFSLTVFLELNLNNSKMLFKIEKLCNLTSAAPSFWETDTYHENQHFSLLVCEALWKLKCTIYSVRWIYSSFTLHSVSVQLPSASQHLYSNESQCGGKTR